MKLYKEHLLLVLSFIVAIVFGLWVYHAVSDVYPTVDNKTPIPIVPPENATERDGKTS